MPSRDQPVAHLLVERLHSVHIFLFFTSMYPIDLITCEWNDTQQQYIATSQPYHGFHPEILQE